MAAQNSTRRAVRGDTEEPEAETRSRGGNVTWPRLVGIERIWSGVRSPGDQTSAWETYGLKPVLRMQRFNIRLVKFSGGGMRDDPHCKELPPFGPCNGWFGPAVIVINVNRR